MASALRFGRRFAGDTLGVLGLALGISICCSLSLAQTTEPTAVQQPQGAQPPGAQPPGTRPTEPPLLPPTRVQGTPPEVPVQPFPSAPGLPGDVGLTPTRGASRLREFGGSVTVIDGAQIANSQQPFLVDALKAVPGLDVAQSGGPGRFTSVFLRGQSSRATKVLVDGIPVNDPSSPTRTFDFASLAAVEIERIEVLRGPQSTLYGSDAVGGVVSIITKRGEGPLQGWVSTMGGSYGTWQSVAHASGGNATGYFSLGASWYDTQSFSVADQRYGRPFNTENDPYRQGTLASRFGWTPCEDFDIDVVLRYLRGHAALDSFNQPPFTLVEDDTRTSSRNEQFYGRVAARLALLDGACENRVAYNHFQINRDFDDPNSAFPPTFSVFHGSTEKFEYQANLLTTKTHRFTAGFDYQIERFDNPPTDPAEHRQADSAFYLQDQVSLWDRWFTTAGIRWDDYELAGPATTWRVASIYRIEATDSALHGSYGTGFIAPSLFELFANAPPFVIGNSSLRPEHARGYEFGFEQRFCEKKVTFDVTYFRIDSTDLIQYVFPTFSNVGRARAFGVEAIGTFRLSDHSTLIANYTHTNTLDLDNNRPLQLRPEHKGSVTLSHDLWNGRGNIYLQLLAIGQRNDYSVPPDLQRMEPHVVVNAAGRYLIRHNVELFGRIDNLFNADYEELVGYGTPRFSAFGGVKITFGGCRCECGCGG